MARAPAGRASKGPGQTPPDDLPARVRRYLDRLGHPASSHDLANRFLRLVTGSEETLVALLSPLMASAGIVYVPDEGWRPAPGLREPRAGGSAAPGAHAVVASSTPRQVACSVGLRQGRIREMAMVEISGAAGAGGAADRGPRRAGSPETNPASGRIVEGRQWKAMGRLLDGAEAIFADPRSEAPPLLRELAARGLPRPASVRSLAAAVRGAVPLRRGATPEEIAGALGCGFSEEATARAAASNVAACVARARLLRDDPAPLREAHASGEEEDASRGGEATEGAAAILDEAFLSGVPASPGVYRFRDARGRLLYVGKAANLRRRLASYAAAAERTGAREGSRRIIRDLRLVRRIEIEETGSELEALLRESELIASRSPRSNVQRQVRERGRRYAAGRLRALLLPGASGAGATVLLLGDGLLLGRCRIGPRGGGMREITRLLGRAMRRGGPSRLAAADPAGTEIVNSWLGRNADRISQVELDSRGGPAAAAKRIAAAVRDLRSGESEIYHHR